MALELGYLSRGELEILLPRSYGAELAAVRRRKKAAKRQWSGQDVTAAVDAITDPAARTFVQRLIGHAEEHSAVVKGGTGATASAGYYYLVASADRCGRCTPSRKVPWWRSTSVRCGAGPRASPPTGWPSSAPAPK